MTARLGFVVAAPRIDPESNACLDLRVGRFSFQQVLSVEASHLFSGVTINGGQCKNYKDEVMGSAYSLRPPLANARKLGIVSRTCLV